MTEIIFRFDQRNIAHCQEQYRGAQRHDYYEGEYAIDSSGPVEVRAGKAAIGTVSVILLESRSRLTFRRSWGISAGTTST